MEPRKRRLTIIGVSVLVLAVAGIGIAQASGRPTAATGAATGDPTTAGTAGTVGTIVAGSLTSATVASRSTTAGDAALDDSAIAAFGLAALAAADGPELDSQPADNAERLRKRLGHLRHPHGKRLERFVHAETTLDLPEKGITTFGADHGTVASIGGGTIAVKRADGQTVTLTTNADTKVRTKGEAVKLGDVKAGDEVLVVSRRTGDTWTAKRIFVVPPTPSDTAPGA